MTVTTVEENIAKFKLMNYVENADSIDKMVLICEKFLKKYKKEDTKKPDVIVAENIYSDMHILQEYTEQERKKYIMHSLAIEMGKAIIDSKYVVIEETKSPEFMTSKIRATVGVYKP